MNKPDDPISLGVLDGLSAVLGQLAEELAFVEENSDRGLRGIKTLLTQLNVASCTVTFPADFTHALQLPRLWLDGLDEGSGFTGALIQDLYAWHDWMMQWLESTVTSQLTPVIPAAWGLPSSTFATIEPSCQPGLTDSSPHPSAVLLPTAPQSDGVGDTILLDLGADHELLREFYNESIDLLQEVEQSVLLIEENPQSTAGINAIFRAFHTFKGSAGFLKLEALQLLAHELESLLELVRSGGLAVTKPVIDAILAGADALADCTHQVGAQVKSAGPATPIRLSVQPVIALVQRAITGAAAPVSAPLSPPSAKDSDDQPGEFGEADLVPGHWGAEAPRPVSDADSVRIDAAKLDALVNLVGELVVAQSLVIESPALQVSGIDLTQDMRRLIRITRELQRNALSLRTVPIRALFRKMGRLVRDLAAREGKQVRLVLEGEDTELDRHLVDKMGDPLVHMIRNAVDHGVETPAERLACSKPPTATITLFAGHQHGGVVIRVSDDGRGIDPQRMRSVAIAKGLIDESAVLGDSQLLDLMFLPGFSTAQTVTDLSGRGVGMDVVRGHIESLRGNIKIDSAMGTGTRFTIRLPLTLAIIDGLLVGLGTERYVIPTLAVRECFRPLVDAISTVHEQGELVSVRGNAIPILRLGQFLRKPMRCAAPQDGVIILVESAGVQRAILVDELLGKQDMIIKTLGPTFESQSAIVGGAVLGDGSVGLILNAETLVRAPQQVRHDSP